MKPKFLFTRLSGCITCLLLSISTPATALDFLNGTIHGFISQGYMHSTDNNYLTTSEEGSFDFNEAALNYSQQLTDSLSAGIQFFARNLGRFGGNEVVIDWAVADYRYRDWLGVRVGKYKTPYGFHNDSRDLDIARTFVFLPQVVYDEGFRDFLIALWGGSIYGLVEIGPAGELEYNAFIGTLHVDTEDPLIQDFYRLQKEGLGDMGVPVSALMNEQVNVDIVYGGQLIWNTFFEPLRLGISGIWADVEIDFDWANLQNPTMNNLSRSSIEMWSWIASAEFVYERLTLTAEYMQVDFPVDNTTLLTATTMPVMPTMTVSTLVKTLRAGWYVSGEYQVNDYCTLGSYYSEAYGDRTDKSSSPVKYQKDIDLSVRFDVGDYCVIKLEGHKVKGWAGLTEFDNPNGYGNKNWYYGLVKVTLTF